MLVAGCVELLREHKTVAIAGGHEHLAARLLIKASWTILLKTVQPNRKLLIIYKHEEHRRRFH